MNRFILVMLLLLCVLLSFVPVSGDGALLLTISTDQKTYEAGDRGVMSLTFSNRSGQLVENIHAEVKSKDILFFTKVAEIEKIEYGSETVQLKFNVRNLEDGEYPVNMYYTYMQTSKQCQGGVCQNVADKKTYNITIKNGEPRISLETNTLTVVDDKTVITFKNSDEVALDFQFDITSDITLQYESYIGHLLSSGSKEIVVYGDPGEYDGTVEVEYRDRFGRNYSKSFLVRIVIGEEPAENAVKVLQPKISEQAVRKIEINAASAEQTHLPQYYVYFVMFSCLFLMGIAGIAKVRNFRS